MVLSIKPTKFACAIAMSLHVSEWFMCMHDGIFVSKIQLHISGTISTRIAHELKDSCVSFGLAADADGYVEAICSGATDICQGL